MSLLISAQHLTKSFDGFMAVDDVTLAVNKGEVLGFLGPNGAGKTTTMRMLTGYLTPTSGSVFIGGIDMLSSPKAAKARIGYLPEGAPLYPDMTPRQLMKFVGEVRGMEKANLKAQMERMIDLLHLSPVADQTVDTLSKGFKRRAGIALALLHDPDILILDEPTDGLDPLQKHEVRSLIQAMRQDKAIIISTHILEEVEAVCSRAVIISDGMLVADGTPQALLKTSGQKTLDDFFRAVVKSKEAAYV